MLQTYIICMYVCPSYTVEHHSTSYNEAISPQFYTHLNVIRSRTFYRDRIGRLNIIYYRYRFYYGKAHVRIDLFISLRDFCCDTNVSVLDCDGKCILNGLHLFSYSMYFLYFDSRLKLIKKM